MIAVVHLVWGPLGPQPLRRFLRSYREHQAGIEHQLVILFNGVASDQRPGLRAELSGFEHELVELPEPVQDLAAYWLAAERLEHDTLCFLNSHSRIQVDRWLCLLEEALNQPDVGLVGASGSWASQASLARFLTGLPSPYKSLWGSRSSVVQVLEEIERGRAGQGDSSSSASPLGALTPLARLRAALLDAPRTLQLLATFPQFPVPHLRTNGFMLARELMIGLRGFSPREKLQAYALESGRRSLTRQVEARGLRTVVVDRSGRTYEESDWPASATFWQGAQQGLLVADNQSDLYQSGDNERRQLLSRYAWGDRAAPTLLGTSGGTEPAASMPRSHER